MIRLSRYSFKWTGFHALEPVMRIVLKMKNKLNFNMTDNQRMPKFLSLYLFLEKINTMQTSTIAAYVAANDCDSLFV